MALILWSILGAISKLVLSQTQQSYRYMKWSNERMKKKGKGLRRAKRGHLIAPDIHSQVASLRPFTCHVFSWREKAEKVPASPRGKEMGMFQRSFLEYPEENGMM